MFVNYSYSHLSNSAAQWFHVLLSVRIRRAWGVQFGGRCFVGILLTEPPKPEE